MLYEVWRSDIRVLLYKNPFILSMPLRQIYQPITAPYTSDEFSTFIVGFQFSAGLQIARGTMAIQSPNCRQLHPKLTPVCLTLVILGQQG